MPNVTAKFGTRLGVLASAMLIASTALSASAERAPIVYANGGESAAVTKTAMPAVKADKKTQRIEFRYPGSTLQLGRSEMASASVPARVTAVESTGFSKAPQFAPERPAFDAASTAAQIAASGAPIVEAAPLQAITLPKPAPGPADNATSDAETVVAIVYGDEFDGLPTANGEIFDQAALTAAHPSLPLPSVVQVFNPATGREVTVRVNDRGPFEDGASLQISRQVSVALGFDGAGKAELQIRKPGATTSAPKARLDVQPKMRTTPVKAAATDELLGGDELVGGSDSPVGPDAAKQVRASVQWPEPPAEWAVNSAVSKTSMATQGALYVQLASFSDIGNAETLYRELRGDLPVEIVPARVNGADYFRVRVGPVDNRETAQELRDRLNAEGKGDGRVVTAE